MKKIYTRYIHIFGDDTTTKHTTRLVFRIVYEYEYSVNARQ